MTPRPDHMLRAIPLSCCLVMLLAGQAPAQRPPPDTLTDAERALATRLAEQAVQQFRTDAPMYLVAMELLRPKEPEEPRRAFVKHYRYDGDLAILTTVDLAGQEVVSLDTVPHLPMPFAEAEVETARRLALADPRVQRAVGAHMDQLRVEALPMRTASPEDPLYQRRVVRLLFRVQRGYLEDPVVLVDLTAGEVIIEDRR